MPAFFIFQNHYRHGLIRNPEVESCLVNKINDYLPFNVAVPNQATAITFQMLLTHTSGIADGSALDDQYYYGEDSPVALASFLENYLVQGATLSH